MKIHKSETVVRYQVSFAPCEVKILARHPLWSQHIAFNRTSRNHLHGEAMLTRTQINAVCDVLGVNGREFMAAYYAAQPPSIADEMLVSLEAKSPVVPDVEIPDSLLHALSEDL